MSEQSRIDRRFAALRQEERKALVTFVTAGDPDYATSEKILLGLPAAGADGVVVGSALVNAVRESLGPKGESTGNTVPKVLDLVKSLSQALRPA